MGTLIVTPTGVYDNREDALTALGEAIGATPKPPTPAKERHTVRIPAVTSQSEDMRVYLAQRGPRVQFGFLLEYVEKPSKTPTGGRFTSRRVTVKRTDGTIWVGQYKKDATTVILRPKPNDA
jgi:hypothetical protein